MGKTKINLASGSVLEKPLVTCFKGSNGNYIVLDNETNNPIGLPIICVSKFTGTSCEKIIDPAEWSSVKENLKTIIAGTALPYLSVPEVLNAQDDFFTQLTLPVASFDLLKSVYAPPASAVPETPADPLIQAPLVSPEPVVEPAVAATPVVATPDPISVAPVVEPAPVSAPVVPEIPAVEAPIIAPVAVETAPPVVAPAPTIAPEVAAPAVVSAPTVGTPSISSDDISAIKENFMKSCENMFDALVKKFEK